MALKFLNKKGWHTGSLRNVENVWKAEQKHEAEQRKLEELKVQIHKEREAEELRQLHIAAGIVPKQDRLEFLYDSGVGVSSSKPSTADEHNSGKAALEPASKPSQPGEKIAPAIPGALFSDSNPISANDKWRKIHSDPLFLIKQQELAALERIRKNPVKMQMLENEVRKNLSTDKKKGGHEDDNNRHEKKKRDHDKKRVREDKHGKKEKHGRDGSNEKKHKRDDPGTDRHRRHDSPERKREKKHDQEERHRKKHVRDDLEREKRHRNYSPEWKGDR